MIGKKVTGFLQVLGLFFLHRLHQNALKCVCRGKVIVQLQVLLLGSFWCIRLNARRWFFPPAITSDAVQSHAVQ